MSRVAALFDATTAYWTDVYADSGASGAVYRARQAVVERWIDDLRVPSGASVLEVGCGAGRMTIELSRRGFRVDAIELSAAMAEVARRNVAAAPASGTARICVGDVAVLDYADDSFDLVVAIGVIPWVSPPAGALHEMARVLRPGGHVIVTADNEKRLSHLLDPLFNPFLKGVRTLVKRCLHLLRLRPERPPPLYRLDHPSRVDRLVAETPLTRIRSATVGFGPFTFLGRELLPRGAAVRVHDWLQRLADRGSPLIRSLGAHYIVLAVKRPASAGQRSR